MEGAQPWMEKINLNGEIISFKLDTGVVGTAITETYFKQCDGSLVRTTKRLYGPGHYLLDVICCYSKLIAKGHSTEQEVYIVAGLTQPLPGIPAIEALQLLHRIKEVIQPETIFTIFTSSIHPSFKDWENSKINLHKENIILHFPSSYLIL